MNHCIDCGKRVNAGHTSHKSPNNVRCLICIEARKLAHLRYVSPAMKRWRKRKHDNQAKTQ